MMSFSRTEAAALEHQDAVGEDAVTPMPAMSGICSKSERPIAPPRNSARSVAIAATSLTIQSAQTTGFGKMLAAHFGQVAPGDDAELGRQRLEQHRREAWP